MKKIKFIILIAFIALALYACGGSTQLIIESQNDMIASGNINDYAKANLPTLSVEYLSNGIPVIIKTNPYNRILNLKVVLNGGVTLSNMKNAGIENIMLSLMTKGSEKYSYDAIAKILSDTSSSISASEGFDSSEYSMNTLDYYFDQVFDVFSDTFMHPAFDEMEFDYTKEDFLRYLQEKANDPYSKTVDNLNEQFLKGHPYAATWDGTNDSIESMKLDDVKKYYEKTFSSNRMFIIAVGNYDNKTLLEKLENTFGSIPNKNVSVPNVSDFLGKVKNDVIIEVNEIGGGLAYVRGDFAIPAPDDPDYVALQLALLMLDDLMFETVRTQNSACYSVWSNVRVFKANYGSIAIYKTAVPDKVKYYIDEAIAYLLNGKVLAPKASASAAGKGGMGEEVDVTSMESNLVPIADALEMYKNIFINSFYLSQQTNAAISTQIEYSVLLHNDYRDYLLTMDKIRALTAEDLVKAAKKYLYDNKIMWSILGSEDVMANVDKSIYQKFTAEDILKK